MANVVMIVLSMTIGIFFILVGIMKLSPILSDDIYREMRKSFIRSAKVFPKYLKIKSHSMRHVVGTIEILGGTMISFAPHILKQFANIVLLIMMSSNLIIHYILNDGLERTTPALVFGLLLICRLIVTYQVNRREKREQLENLTKDKKCL